MLQRKTLSLLCSLGLAALAAAPPAAAVDLVGVHDLAVKNDPALLAAASRREATGENPRQAWANLLPNLSGQAQLSRGEVEIDFPEVPEVDASTNDVDTEVLSLNFEQSIYNQSNYEQLDIARAQVSQSEADYQLAYQDFLLRVAIRYFDVLLAIDEVTFSEAEEAAFQRQFEQAEQRFEVGLTAVTDVYEARASFDQARARRIVAENRLADAFEGLRELTGVYFEAVDPLQEDLPLVEPTPGSDEAWVRLAVQSNPQVLAARYGVDVAEATVRLERASFFPTVDAFADYQDFTDNEAFNAFVGTQTTVFTQESLRYGLRLNVPLYQGGVRSSRTRQAGHLLDASMQDEEAVLRNIVRITENNFRGVIAGIEQVQAFGQAVVSAESALEATQAGFEVGTRTIVDVLLAEQRFYQAQRDLSTVRHQYILDHLRLKASAGLLNENDLHLVNTLLE